jgi:hypothetical protein
LIDCLRRNTVRYPEQVAMGGFEQADFRGGTGRSTSLGLPRALAERLARDGPAVAARAQQCLARLHETNAELWSTEDRVRSVPPDGVAPIKRRIDELNATRNDAIEHIDETLVGAWPSPDPNTPPHTESLGSALDRMSVLELRIAHTREGARAEPALARRLPALEAQHADLVAAIDQMAADLLSGARRAPQAARFKLYARTREADARLDPALLRADRRSR